MLLILIGYGGIDFADDAPTMADIPKGLSPELESAIKQTFSPDINSRVEACHQLKDMGVAAAPAVPFLIRLLDDHTSVSFDSEYVDSTAARALAAIGKPAIEPTIAALSGASDNKRHEIAFTLGLFNDSHAIQALVTLLDDPDANTREMAALSLKDCIRENPNLAKLPGLVDSLVSALGNFDRNVRYFIVPALGATRDPQLWDSLIKMRNDPDQNVRSSALEALAQIDGKRAEPMLLEILENHKNYRGDLSAAADALGKLGVSSAIPALISLLRDDSVDSMTRWTPAYQLRNFDTPEVAKTLIAVAKNRKEHYLLRVIAIESIAHLEGRKAIPLLSELAVGEGTDNAIGWSASYSLVNITDGAVDDPRIIKGINSVRGDSDDYDAISALKNIIENGKSRSVRDAARKALEERGMPQIKEYRHWVLLSITCVFYVMSLGLWIYVKRKPIQENRMSSRSRLLFIVLMVIGLPLIYATWNAW